MLLLSRCDRRLSDRFSSGGDRKLELQNGILCGRISDFCRSIAGQAGLRIPVSVRTDPGSAQQDSVSEKNQDISRRQTTSQAEICNFSYICNFIADVCGRYHGTGRTVFLQTDLPGRNTGRWSSACIVE